MEKYSKNHGGSFKITLLAYSQRGRKNNTQTSHFGEVLGARILPISRKSRSEFYMKNNIHFNTILYRFLVHFRAPGRPKNLIFFNFLSSCCRSCATWAPRGFPKCSKRAPDLDFKGFGTVLSTILDQIFIDLRVHFNKQSNIYIYIYAYVCRFRHIYICIYICIYIYIHTRLNLHFFHYNGRSMNINDHQWNVSIHIYVCIYIYIHIYMYRDFPYALHFFHIFSVYFYFPVNYKHSWNITTILIVLILAYVYIYRYR